MNIQSFSHHRLLLQQDSHHCRRISLYVEINWKLFCLYLFSFSYHRLVYIGREATVKSTNTVSNASTRILVRRRRRRARPRVPTVPSVAYLDSTPTLCCRAGTCQIFVFPRAAHWSPSLVSLLQINPFRVLFQAREGRLGLVFRLAHTTTIPFNGSSTPGSIEYPSLTPRKLMCYSRSHRYEHPCTSTSQLTNRDWALLNLYKNVQKLLLIAGIETNPGPDRQESLSKLSIAHVNINSITAPGKLDELEQFVDSNNIHILALSEIKTEKSTPVSTH